MEGHSSAATSGGCSTASTSRSSRFLLLDIQRSFTVDKALAGALGTITLIFRVAGGIGAGTAADRWGRKGPLMFSILWYSVFAFLSGFSTSYGMLFALRALFGIGMGGVWAAGMPLTLEHWPTHPARHGVGHDAERYSLGFLLSSIVFEFGYPLVSHNADLGWRTMLWTRDPAVVRRVVHHEGGQGKPGMARAAAPISKSTVNSDTLSLVRLFKPGPSTDDPAHLDPHGRVPVHVSTRFTYWYPTLIGQMQRPTLPFLAALNIGAIIGAVAFGAHLGRALGRRGSAHDRDAHRHPGHSALRLHAERHAPARRRAHHGIFSAPATSGSSRAISASASRRWRARSAPASRITSARASDRSQPTLVGMLQDRGLALPTAMAACIAGSGALVILLLWMGPETRGRHFTAQG